MTFLLLVSLPILLQHSLILWTAIIHLSQLLNKHAPFKSQITRTKPRNPLYTLALKKLKLAKRHLERIWSRTHSFEDLKNLRSATNHYHAAIIKLNEPIILLSFHPALHILVNFGEIIIYFFIALLYLLYPLMTL